MIRINLLHDVSQLASKKKKFTFGASSSEKSQGSIVSQGDQTRQFLTRVIVFVIPLIFSFGQKEYKKSVSDSDLKRVEMENQALQAKLRTLDPAVKEVEKYQEEKKRLDSQLEVIKQLSKERLKNVKSLDSLQAIIPAKAWLTSLKLEDKKVDIEGLAVDDIVVSEFMQAMSSTIYFSNVTLISSEEAKRSEGVVKKFKIKCTLENL
jgi:type IV pilus assembly protein PilN